MGDELPKRAVLSAGLTQTESGVPPEPTFLTVTAAIPAHSSEFEPMSLERCLDGSSCEVVRTLRNDGFTEPSSSANQSRSFPVAQWERYEFLSVLGHGGMGSVYEARDRRISRIVALKFMAGTSDRLRARLLQEARAQARIDHAGVCKVYEVGEVEGKIYIAMQFVNGQPLDQAKEKLSLREKVQVIEQTARALHVAHELGIIHRDIKPSNIMLESLPAGGRRPVLMDFGIARDANDGTGITESGVIMGTAAYMSPEQARGDIRHLDRRTDVYSLGATLFELCAGVPPFRSAQTHSTPKIGQPAVAPSLSERLPDFPAPLDVIISKCLNHEPEQRYATARELADDLERFLLNRPIVGKKVSLPYRIGFFAKRNRLLVALGVALLLSLLGLSGYGIRTRILTQRKEALARQQAALAHQLGRSVEQMEWLARMAYAMPLHDTSYEMGLVRQRMSEIESQMRSSGELGRGLADYALGRGHLALHEWRAAYEHLLRAQSSGLVDLELEYSLGLVQGELYSVELKAARRSGDQSFLKKREQELRHQYLEPALAHLQNSRELKTVSADYVQGLIAYHQRNDEEALMYARKAQQQAPWQYEAVMLEGDVYLAQALSERDRGEYEAAETHVKLARKRYEQAGEQGRSDARVYESLAETWIRQMDLDGLRSADPRVWLEPALAAADRALRAAPASSSGATKKAFAYLLAIEEAEARGNKKEQLAMTQRLIEESTRAVGLHPDDAYAREALGNGYIFLADYEMQHGQEFAQHLSAAKEQLTTATSINPRFPWAHNDLGRTYLVEGEALRSHHQDATDKFLKAIESFNAALELDPDYLFAHSNLASTYVELIRQQIERGMDPSDYLKKLNRSAQSVLKINDKLIVAHGAIVLGNIFKAIYELEALQDVSHSVQTAQEHLKLIIGIQSQIPIPYQHMALIYIVLAKQQLSKSAEAAQTIQDGLLALATCQKLSLEPDGTCASLEALLWALRAQEQKRQGQSPQASLEQARIKAALAVERAPLDTDVLLVAAESSMSAAAVRLSAKLPAIAEIDAGLAVIDRALRIAPSWPRALAVKSALLILKAKSAASEATRAALLGQARQLVVAAAAVNPLVLTAYSGAFRELDPLK